jgi:hypothetical protein
MWIRKIKLNDDSMTIGVSKGCTVSTKAVKSSLSVCLINQIQEKVQVVNFDKRLPSPHLSLASRGMNW